MWIAVIIADLVRIETDVAGAVIMSVGDTLSGYTDHIKREDAARPCTEEIEKQCLFLSLNTFRTCTF